jgi:hypothetical protein
MTSFMHAFNFDRPLAAQSRHSARYPVILRGAKQSRRIHAVYDSLPCDYPPITQIAQIKTGKKAGGSR